MSNDRNNMPASNDDFEFWENAAITYDIAIDEERYSDVVKCDVKNLEEILRINDRNDFLNNIRKNLHKLDIESTGNDNKPVKIKSSDNPQNKFWAFLFIAKKVRAILQSQDTDKATEKLDWLVDFLVCNIGNYVDEPNKYLFLMLELSAITIGEQSLGFSEKAKEVLNLLNSIKGFPEEKEHAYKALIHYNQGLARAHMHQLHEALEEYNKAIEEFKNRKTVDNIWYNYIYFPALLQKADVLSKMQFSFNALNTLEEIKDCNAHCPPSAFKKARKEILKAFCYFDLSAFDVFDEHFKTINELKDKDGQYYFNKKSFIKPQNSSPLNGDDFLKAQTPQVSPGEMNLPSLLASHYNSLVIERAKEVIKEKLKNDKKQLSSGLDNYGIFTFIEEYMGQCENNRFDRLTLKETVLEYIEILEPLIDQDLELKKSFSDEGPIIQILNRLLKLLNGPNGKMKFSKEEIDPVKKPPIPPHVIDKALKVLEDINDKILKEWFARCSKNGVTIERLLQYLQTFFEFEKTLIKEIKSKQEHLLKEYDKRNLNIREHLLNKISEYYNEPSKVRDLKNHLVCIDNSEGSTGRDKCLSHMLDAIKGAVGEDEPKEGEILQISDYDKILGQEAERFHKHITGRSIQPVFVNKKEDNDSLTINYIGLRRWNSFTPELSFSVGGGYFVFLSDDTRKVLTGIAVDPGFDFIRNFFHQGFTLTDIDLVLLTHGHPDHIRDFPAIVELLHEQTRLPEDKKASHKIYSVMSLGCYQRLKEYIAKPPYRLLFYDTFVLDIDKHNQSLLEFEYIEGEERNLRLVPTERTEANGGKIKLEIKCFNAFHQDHSESDSYGYKLIVSQNSNQISIGFTGDSKWFPEYADNFKDCDLICSHIGSIVETNKKGKQLKDYEIVGQAERLIRTKNHPYLFGEILFLQDWKDKVGKKTLILISEFGEEMKGKIRPDLIKRFNRVNSKTVGCWSCFGAIKNENNKCECDSLANCQDRGHKLLTIPVDVGLRISIPLKKRTNSNNFSQQVYCSVCEKFVEPQTIDYEVYGHEEAIFYICKTCLRSKSIDVRHAIYQKHQESGYELRKE